MRTGFGKFRNDSGVCFRKSGGCSRTRTCDPLIKSVPGIADFCGFSAVFLYCAHS